MGGEEFQGHYCEHIRDPIKMEYDGLNDSRLEDVRKLYLEILSSRRVSASDITPVQPAAYIGSAGPWIELRVGVVTDIGGYDDFIIPQCDDGLFELPIEFSLEMRHYMQGMRDSPAKEMVRAPKYNLYGQSLWEESSGPAVAEYVVDSNGGTVVVASKMSSPIGIHDIPGAHLADILSLSIDNNLPKPFGYRAVYRIREGPSVGFKLSGYRIVTAEQFEKMKKLFDLKSREKIKDRTDFS